ncbi:MFS general substrate transporter [Metschnikowia bicuspidata var. bicuspidata NRRL YB-4993]|uniref:MFS general substrate transporter n=1 Tax=Metschnikowia bicuspidata var. bicuspidata NRRL YB-4993 TaxID=869754 RepID=A0A1A0HC94_9ASCO|nr:MFS general substrate transporter [Metschnikowia bicuspidata var. bicuspidata NRRL YB-4993]OBA21615.1 MFS general substrate transporter [Metschnikowia bicuspidata var. bicuspidata NRRL YB-4993]
MASDSIELRSTGHGSTTKTRGNDTNTRGNDTNTSGNDTNTSGNSYPEGGWKAYLVVLGSHLGLMVHFGILNAVGAVQAYVSSHQLAGEAVSSVSWVFSIYMCLPFFLGALVGPVFDRRGSKQLLAASTALLFAGFLALSFSLLIVAFLFSLSLCLGTAHALAIPPLVSLLSHWFLVHRGKALGLASLGGSVGGTIWPLVLQALYGSVGYAWAIRVVGAVAVCLLAASVFLVELRFTLRTHSPPEQAASKTRRLAASMRRHLDVSAFREPRFAALVAGVFLTEIALLSVVTYLASYALAHGFSEKHSLLLLTLLNAAGIPGRYLLGLMADRYGSVNTMVVMLSGFCVSIFAVWLPGGGSAALWGFAAFFGFCSSSILSLTPVCLGLFTPVAVFGRCYGLMYTFSSTGILFGIPVGSAIIDDSSVASYRNFTVFCGCFAVAGTVSWGVCRYLLVGARLNVKV